jgi:GH24 family phage-related lysozyme (muramidase)
MANHAQLIDMLTSAEGSLSHLYLDTVGLVTVGVGHMIPNIAAAQTLSFVVRASGAAATADQIAGDYENVSRQQKGLLAARYQAFTALDMTASAIQDLLNADISAIEAGVRSRFAGYDTYPEPAQDALLDMAFNLGVGGLASHYPHLKAAAEARDWATCALQCHRNGISDARNERTKALFQSAASA